MGARLMTGVQDNCRILCVMYDDGLFDSGVGGHSSA